MHPIEPFSGISDHEISHATLGMPALQTNLRKKSNGNYDVINSSLETFLNDFENDFETSSVNDNWFFFKTQA